MSRPVRDAVDALVVLVVGLGLLTLLAAATYRPGGPRWPHVVVDGGTWLLLAVAGVVVTTSLVRLAVARWLR